MKMGFWSSFTCLVSVTPALFACSSNLPDSDASDEGSKPLGSVSQAVTHGTVDSGLGGRARSLVRMVYAPAGAFSSNIMCTAVLLRRDWVLTAKHCVVDFGTAAYAPYDYIGIEHAATSKRVYVPPANIHLHPDHMVDVALLELNTPIDSGQGDITLYTGAGTELFGTGTEISVYGYGFSDEPPIACSSSPQCPPNFRCRGGVCNALRRAERPIVDLVTGYDMQGTSRYAYRYLNIGPSSSGQQTGPGDSGGPGFLSDDQLLTVTGGNPWKVYAKVFRHWAKGVMDPSSFGTLTLGKKHDDFARGSELAQTGDFNADGRADMISFNRTTGEVKVSVVSQAGVFSGPSTWLTQFATGIEEPLVGDLNGDGSADIMACGDGYCRQALSTGVGFGPATPAVGVGVQVSNGDVPKLGDMDGDGLVDFVNFSSPAQRARVNVHLNCRSNPGGPHPAGCQDQAADSFAEATLWHEDFHGLNDTPDVGDFNGDGLDDLVSFNAAGEVIASLTNRPPCSSDADCGGAGCVEDIAQCANAYPTAAVGTQFVALDFATNGALPRVADMNGDGTDDLISFATNGEVRVRLSRQGSFTYPMQMALDPVVIWGVGGFQGGGELAALGDVNRDGRADVFRFVRGSGEPAPGAVVGDVYVGMNR